VDTSFNPLFKALFTVAVVVALFTGFGNMPLYGRYYVADMPGLAWSGNFFINVNVHILTGSLLLAMGVYTAATLLLSGWVTTRRLTLAGKISGTLLSLTLITGVLMVFKNLPGVRFPLEVLMTANFAHMGTAVLFTLAALISLVFRKPWRRE
jgi:hypothetical protein